MTALILRNDPQRAAFIERLYEMPFPLNVEVTPYAPKRNDDQNALAWVIVTAISEQVKANGRFYSKDAWWWWLKKDKFGPEFEELPNGEVKEIEPKSRFKNKIEFAEFIEFLWYRATEMEVIVPEQRRFG